MRRVLAVLAAFVLASVTFVSAAVAGVLLHLDVEATRRLVAKQATRALSEVLEGSVVVERIGGLGLGGVDGVRARVRDADGVTVLFLDGVRVRVRAVEALRSLLAPREKGGDAPIRVRVDEVSIEHVEAVLDAEPGGDELRLVRALTPRDDGAPPEPGGAPGRPLHVDVRRVALAHAWAHGAPPRAPAIDAELRDLRGAARIEGGAVRADLDHVAIVTRGLPRRVDPTGALVGHVSVPAEGDRTLVEGAFDGRVAGVPTTLTARVDGKRVDARLDVARASAERLRAVLGGELSPRADAELHVEAHGELPRIAAFARLRGAGASVDVDGTVVLAEDGRDTRVSARVSARDVDASAIVAGAPATDLALDARGDLTLRAGEGPRGDVAIDTLPGTVLGDPIPQVQIRARVSGDSAWGGLRVLSDDLPTEAGLAIVPVDGQRVLDAQLRVDVPELARAPVIGAHVRGSARARAEGRMNLATRALVLRADVHGAGLERQDQRVETLSLGATAMGTLAHLEVDAELRADEVRLGALGTLDGVSARARVERGVAPIGPAGVVLRDARVDVDRADHRLSATAARVEVAGARLRVVDAVVAGLGDPLTAQVERTSRELHVAVDAPAVDLARVAGFLGRGDDVRAGTLSVQGEVTKSAEDVRGDMHVALEGLATTALDRGGARLDASVRDGEVALAIEATLGDVGQLTLRTDDLVLGGAALRPDSWRRATGRIRLDGDVSLTKLAATVPDDVLPLGELGGEVVLRGVAWKRRAEAPPRLKLSAYTRGLLLAGRAAPERAIGATRVKGVAPWRSQDFDVQVDARVDSGAADNELAVRVYDRVGIVAALDAKAILPVDDIVLRPSSAVEALLSAPLSVKVVVPERSLARMPSVIGARNVAGRVEAELDLHGTVLEPRVDLVAKAHGVHASWLPVQLATDAALRARYDGATADLGVTLRAENRDVLALASQVQITARELVMPSSRERADASPPWTGGAYIKLDRFPLEAVGALADRRVKGRASGEVVMAGLNRDAHLRGEIALAPLTVGRARYTGGRVTLDARDGRLVAGARVEQEGGWLDVRAGTGLSWGAALVPSLDASRPLEGRLRARAFRVAALAPFVQGPLDDLDGRLDADASIAVGPEARRLEGVVALRDGRVQITALGEELREVRGKLTLRPDGTILVEDVYARGSEGEIAAKGIVRTAGLAFESAEGRVAIPRRDPLSFALEGQPVGRISGIARLDAKAVPGEDRVDVRVDIPELHAELPQSMKSGLQELAEDPHVRVGVYRRSGEFVRLPLDKEDLGEDDDGPPPTTIVLDVHVGEATIVRGNQARVVVRGNPRVTLAEETRISGQIQLVRGRLEVQGKEFEVERGVVTFQPDDTSNPVVVATASWTASDGTKVYADFTGPLQTGKVNLRSEPARPKNEILALILFGTAEGMNATPAPPGRAPDGTTKAAVGIGGGFAARGLTEALDDLAGIQATARIDTTKGRNPRPELEIQIAKNIAVELGHVLGTPPITEPDKNLVTFDWRFARSWSLETTFGDRGRAMLDAVWQKRY